MQPFKAVAQKTMQTNLSLDDLERHIVLFSKKYEVKPDLFFDIYYTAISDRMLYMCSRFEKLDEPLRRKPAFNF